MENKLRVVWRKMLRYVFRLHQRSSESEQEDWVDYMKRSTHELKAMSVEFGLEDWAVAYRRRKFRFAGRTARQTDNRWTRATVEWIPNGGVGRSPSRPVTRWSDDLEKYAGGDWQNTASDRKLWAILEEGFAVNEK